MLANILFFAWAQWHTPGAQQLGTTISSSVPTLQLAEEAQISSTQNSESFCRIRKASIDTLLQIGLSVAPANGCARDRAQARTAHPRDQARLPLPRLRSGFGPRLEH